MGRLDAYPPDAFPSLPAATNRRANAFLRVLQGALTRLPGGRRHTPPATVLVVRLGNLGDIIVSLPAFRALRKQHPEARLILLTSPTKRGAPGAVEVLENDDTFDEIIVYYEDESAKPGFVGRLARRLRQERVDLAVYLAADRTGLGNILKHAALLVIAGVRRFQGLELFAEPWLRAHTTDRLLYVVGEDGPGAAELPWLQATAEDAAVVDALLAPTGGRPLVALQCGAKRPANRWAAENFIAVGRRLVEQHDCWIVLPGSPGESALTAEVAAGIGERCLDLAGRTTIAQLGALAGRCAVFVTNDTGTMHVAVAMGVPVVAVFGGRYYPYVWHPYGAAHTVFRAPIECSPCIADTCPRYDAPECLRLVAPDAVADAASEALAAAQR